MFKQNDKVYLHRHLKINYNRPYWIITILLVVIVICIWQILLCRSELNEFSVQKHEFRLEVAHIYELMNRLGEDEKNLTQTICLVHDKFESVIKLRSTLSEVDKVVKNLHEMAPTKKQIEAIREISAELLVIINSEGILDQKPSLINIMSTSQDE